jgi:hypothetical protein
MADETTGPPAEQLLGSDAIVGLTYLDQGGEVRDVVEVHGVVTAIDETTVTLQLPDGTPFTLPPDPGAFSPAPPERA